MITLPYGNTPLTFDPKDAFIVELPPPPPPVDLKEATREALQNPIGAPPLPKFLEKSRSVALVVNDRTRRLPSSEVGHALREILAAHAVTLVVANGTHAPAPDAEVIAQLRQSFGEIPSSWRLSQHNADAPDLVFLGHTRRGTEVRLSRAVAEAERVIILGHLKPHYFAGYSGGYKGIFPGCAGRAGILRNHLLKADPSARIGKVNQNACREDMEEAARLGPSAFVIDEIGSPRGEIWAVVAGDPILAQRRGAALAEQVYHVSAPKTSIALVSGSLPVSASLYQAAKLIAATAPLLKEDATLIVAAECADGTGPLDRVNEGIYRLGLLPLLPQKHEILLVSSLPEEEAKKTFATPAKDIEEALRHAKERLGDQRVVVIPDASELILSPR